VTVEEGLKQSEKANEKLIEGYAMMSDAVVNYFLF
jgi:hypothetical protein